MKLRAQRTGLTCTVMSPVLWLTYISIHTEGIRIT